MRFNGRWALRSQRARSAIFIFRLLNSGRTPRAPTAALRGPRAELHNSVRPRRLAAATARGHKLGATVPAPAPPPAPALPPAHTPQPPTPPPLPSPLPTPTPVPFHLHPNPHPLRAFAFTPVGFGGIVGGLLSASVAVMPHTRSSHKRGLADSSPTAARPAALLNIPEGEFYLIDGKRLRITDNSSVRGAGTIGSTANSYVVEAIAAGDKKWELRDANATVTLPDGGGVARLADMCKNDQFVIHQTDAAAGVTHRLLVRVAQAPRHYRSHGQALADLREAVMPLSVSSRLSVQPRAVMFTEAWGEEVYQLGVCRRTTFDPHRRKPVVALRVEPVGWLTQWKLKGGRAPAPAPPVPQPMSTPPQDESAAPRAAFLPRG